MSKEEQNKIEIVKIKAEHKTLKDKIDGISEQVFNHIPTDIKELKKEFTAELKAIRQDLADYKLNQSKWLVGILVSTLLMFIGLILNLIK